MTPTLSAERASDVRCHSTDVGRSRILLAVHSTKLGGAERMALLEAEHLQARFELLLSAPDDGPLRSRFAAHGEIVRATATLPLWGASVRRWGGGLVGTLRDVIPMAMLIRRRGVELVLTNSSVCVTPVLAAKLAGVPVVVHARDVPKSRFAPLVLALHGKLADTVIVIADGLAPYFRRGGARTRVVRVVDGITMPAAASRTRDALGSPLRLCLVGGIDPRKGQDVAVAALAQLRERGVQATLEFVGRELDERFTTGVREDARRLGVADEVEFVGEVDDIGPYLDRADIVIAPSRGEWTPLVLMEALARGKPVVASSVGSVAEVVRDRESGLLVAPESPGELADAIAELLADPAQAAAMAGRGRMHIDNGFRIEHTLDGLQTEIDRLLAREPGGLRREPSLPRAVL
jgi:glycosyltransferase involved in cell wall biosynthesis